MVAAASNLAQSASSRVKVSDARMSRAASKETRDTDDAEAGRQGFVLRFGMLKEKVDA